MNLDFINETLDNGKISDSYAVLLLDERDVLGDELYEKMHAWADANWEKYQYRRELDSDWLTLLQILLK